jgi:hypothetical protein
MTTLRVLFLMGLVASIGCGDDDGTSTLQKGEVDESMLTSGVVVSLASGQGSVVVPFSTPVPDVPDDDFEDEMSGAVSLLVSSNASGASADLMAGTLVSGPPSGPGEYNWSLNGDRDRATMTFFNQTPAGLTLKPGNTYTAQLAVTTNDYVDRVSAISFQVTVQ